MFKNINNSNAQKFEAKSLLVIINDRVSDLITKGEITERYYNPGNLFEQVHLLLINDDRPDVSKMRKMAGSAQLFVYNLPPPNYKKTLGWHPVLLRTWAEIGIELAKKINPSLVRCHGAHLNTFLAAKIKQATGIPYIVSMHTNPDLDIRARTKIDKTPFKHRLQLQLLKKIEKIGIESSDVTICVYKFIESYARRLKASRIETIYNAVNPENLLPKTDYSIKTFPKLVVPGRQIVAKDPTPVIEALASLPSSHLTLIGDGVLHSKLKEVAKKYGVHDRCEFVSSMNNDELCSTLKDYDILISVNDFGGVSKVELEASLIGMPVITNRHPLEKEPEILGENCLVTDGSARSYAELIQKFIDDQDLRERFGAALRRSVQRIRPEIMEENIANLYQHFLLKQDQGVTRISRE